MAAARTQRFGFRRGRRLGRTYVIERLLGAGTEGEVYQVRDEGTGIRRAAKLYFPQKDPQNKKSVRHAQRLNALRHCPIVLQYHHSELVTVGGEQVVAMISELFDGEPLERWLDRQPGGRLSPYMALHVLFDLVRGIEAVHALGFYHADVHSQNILIQPRGVRFDMKLIDFYDWGRPAAYKQRQDIADTVRVFYECLGGRAHYGQQPAPIRYICAAMRRPTILKRFPTMSALRQHIETFPWRTLEG